MTRITSPSSYFKLHAPQPHRLSPSPLSRMSYMPHQDQSQTHDDDLDLDPYVSPDQHRFEAIYGPNLWSQLQDEVAFLATDVSVSTGSEGTKVQVTIKLLPLLSGDEGTDGGDDEEMENRQTGGGGGWQLVLEILSAPAEKGARWTMRSFSTCLTGMAPPSAAHQDHIAGITYSLRRLQRNLERDGFHLEKTRAYKHQAPGKKLFVHTNMTGKDQMFLPLDFEVNPDIEQEVAISVAYHTYLLETQRADLKATYEQEKEKDEGSSTRARDQDVSKLGMSIKQFGKLLDKKAAEHRDNAGRFKSKMEQQTGEGSQAVSTDFERNGGFAIAA